MTAKQQEQVYTPNLMDPERLDDYEGTVPDDYISFPNPFDLGKFVDIPIRVLDIGEAMTYIFAITDKSPEMPEHIKNKKRSDLNAEERKAYQETQTQIDEVMNEAVTDVTLEAILQEGWTRERVAKLPITTRTDGYAKAMRAVRGEAGLAAETFLEKSSQGMSENAGSVSSSTGDESGRGDADG